MARTARIVTPHGTFELHDEGCDVAGAVGVKDDKIRDGSGNEWPLELVKQKLAAIRAQQGDKVIYCAAGLSRSATFAILYLWLSTPDAYTLPQAIAAVSAGYANGGTTGMKADLVERNLTTLLLIVSVEHYALNRGEGYAAWQARITKGAARAVLFPPG